jgi:photosystem II stability/assembly factor-like uncharacterized protein
MAVSRHLNAIDFMNSNQACIAASDGSLLISFDGGFTWQEANAGLLPAKPIFDVAHYLNTYYACSQNGVIISSSDSGLTWQQIQLNTGESFYAISFNTSGEAYVCGTNGIIRRFNGSIWQSSASGTTENLNDIKAMSTGYLAVGNNGIIRRFSNNLLDTIDAGTNRNLNAIFMQNTDTGFVCGDNGLILRTTDGGSQWTAILNGSDANLNSIIAKGDSIWATGNLGRVVISSDGGNSWLEKKVNPKQGLNDLAFNQSINKVFITGNNNLLKMFGDPDAIEDTVSVKISQHKVQALRLFPNPANDFVNVEGISETDGFIEATWFDQKGVKLSSRPLSSLKANTTLQFNVSTFASGIYFLRLEGEASVTFKVMIIR